MECQLAGAGTKEWKECWAMPLEWVDMAVSVSKVEWIGDLDMDMPRWVEEMKEVLVETVKWTTYSTARQTSDSWVDFQDKVPAVAS
jgi:hypothetical protein